METKTKRIVLFRPRIVEGISRQANRPFHCPASVADALIARKLAQEAAPADQETKQPEPKAPAPKGPKKKAD